MPTILLVDDYPDILSSLEALLKICGFDSIIACGLEEGLKTAKTSSYDCVITDKNLECHRGVLPLLNFMQEERPATPVILYSAEDGEQARKELYCHGFVSKRYPEDLIRTIKRVLSLN